MGYPGDPKDVVPKRYGVGPNTFDKGWLERGIRDSVNSLMADHDRDFFAFDQSWHERQLTPTEIDALAASLERRFKSWTGFSLAHYRARRSSKCCHSQCSSLSL